MQASTRRLVTAGYDDRFVAVLFMELVMDKCGRAAILVIALYYQAEQLCCRVPVDAAIDDSVFAPY